MKKQLWNKNWTYISQSAKHAVTLPHDAMILKRRDPDGANTVNTGYFQGEDCVYEKTFLPEQGVQQAVLEFDGVYKDATVFVNETPMGGCRYGYSNFLVDISQAMKTGEKNQIRVEVKNADAPNSRWYTGTGIYRDIFLHTGGSLVIDPDGVRVSVSNLEKDLAILDVTTNLRSISSTDQYAFVQTEIKASDGRVVALEKSPISLEQQPCTFCGDMVRQRLYIKDPLLWDLDNPTLYSCKTTVLVNETAVDTSETTFGIRSILIDPYHGFRLNGKSMKLRGGCIHHDSGILGAIDTIDTALWRVDALKKAGFNTLRIAHNPASKVILEACDRLGMLVIDESFDMWNFPKNPYDSHLYFKEEWEQILTSWVRKNYNHPSVIFYSIGNEIQEIGTTLGGRTSRMLAEKVRSMDNTRFIVNAINGMMCVMDDMDAIIPLVFTEEEIKEKQIKRPVTDINYALTLFLDRTEKINLLDKVTDMLAESSSVLDVVGYNYAAGRYKLDQKNNPNRVTVGSETFPSDIAKNWELVKEIPQLIGDFTWTAWDYLGETGIGAITYNTAPSFSQPYPFFMAYCGDFDLTGFRRPASYWREIVWELRKDPYIGVHNPAHAKDNAFCTPWSIGPAVASWSWDGYEGVTTKVEVYAPGDTVELFLNDCSLGKKQAGAAVGFRTEYEVTYAPGELKAVSYEKGSVIGVHRLFSAKPSLKLRLTPQETALQTGANGYRFVRIELADECGTVAIQREDCIQVEVTGGGTLAALGSANPKGRDDFFANTCHLYEGAALAAIRGADVKENIVVRVSCEGFEDVTTSIAVV